MSQTIRYVEPQVSVVWDGTVRVAHILKEVGLTTSISEAIRLIDQNGVRVDGEKIIDRHAMLKVTSVPVVLQVGKRKFKRVRFQMRAG